MSSVDSDPGGVDRVDGELGRPKVASSGEVQGPASGSEREQQSEAQRKILVEADARDVASDKRARAADLEAFLGPDEAYNGLEERQAAAVDRSHARGDREASAEDRVRLTEDDAET